MAHFVNEEPSIPETRIEHGCIIWELKIPYHPAVYMTADVSNYNYEQRYVVFVRGFAFYRLACATAHISRNRFCTIGDIQNDRKISGQTKIWSNSATRPVPLANIGFDHLHGIGFVDGTTRTLWLVQNACPVFPVELYDRDSAFELWECIGFKSIEPKAISELFPFSSETCMELLVEKYGQRN